VKYYDIEVGFDFEPEPGLADNGDLEHDLQALLKATGAAAQSASAALAMFVDELQYVEEEELAALITALHRTAQRPARSKMIFPDLMGVSSKLERPGGGAPPTASELWHRS